MRVSPANFAGLSTVLNLRSIAVGFLPKTKEAMPVDDGARVGLIRVDLTRT